MLIQFCGAAGGVTGSNHLLTVLDKKILLDCGLFQGDREWEKKNTEDFLFDPKEIDAVLISHAHLDHIGRLPKLVRDGFSGPVYMTEATSELAVLIWEDAYKIMQEKEKKYNIPKMYELEDIAKVREQIMGIKYREKQEIFPGIEAIWKDAGHIFGSSFIEIYSSEGSLAFSGDLGNSNVPILRETDQLGAVDTLLIESTYGNRLHEAGPKDKLFFDIISSSIKENGTIMIPSFSLERTQEILYYLSEFVEEGKIDDIPIFLDSPLAIRAIPVYEKYTSYYDREACVKYKKGTDFFSFSNLKLTESVEDSKEINGVKGKKIIIAGSGMMTGGRIIHHALRYLQNPNNTIIFVGYQAEGTLGRKILDREKEVQIYREVIPVKAEVKAIGALSAHGDQDKLLSWVRNAEELPKKIFCVHGEGEATSVLAGKFTSELGIEAKLAEFEKEEEL